MHPRSPVHGETKGHGEKESSWLAHTKFTCCFQGKVSCNSAGMLYCTVIIKWSHPWSVPYRRQVHNSILHIRCGQGRQKESNINTVWNFKKNSKLRCDSRILPQKRKKIRPATMTTCRSAQHSLCQCITLSYTPKDMELTWQNIRCKLQAEWQSPVVTRYNGQYYLCQEQVWGPWTQLLCCLQHCKTQRPEISTMSVMCTSEALRIRKIQNEGNLRRASYFEADIERTRPGRQVGTSMDTHGIITTQGERRITSRIFLRRSGICSLLTIQVTHLVPLLSFLSFASRLSRLECFEAMAVKNA